MATAIRLTRLGGHKRPFYRIVVIDSSKPRDGRYIEQLGYYDPLTAGEQVKLDVERAREWISKGARPSNTVEKILKKLSADQSVQSGSE